MSPIDAFLREIECFDLKWFAELGGYAARAEVSALRQMAGQADKRLDTAADTNSDDSPRPLNLGEVIGNEAARLDINWMDHTQALLVGPDAVMKLARIREALFGLAAGQLTGAACLQTIAQSVLSIEDRAALHVPKVISPRPAPTSLKEPMTEEDIERLEPSRTLDATVAHDVLHCRPSMSDYEHRLEAFCDCSDSRHEQACSYVDRMLARYSTNLEAAWGVIEYLLRDDFRVNLTHDDAGWRCVFETRLIDGTTGHYESGPTPTAPLAICRAALKAAKAE